MTQGDIMKERLAAHLGVEFPAPTETETETPDEIPTNELAAKATEVTG